MIENYSKIKDSLILIRQNDKIPFHRRWDAKIEDFKDIKNAIKEGFNLGITFRKNTSNWMVIDVDFRNKGDESFKKLCENFNLKVLKPNVKTPRGEHYYFIKPIHDVKIRKRLNGYKGIDFLSGKMCAILPPSKTTKGEYQLINNFDKLDFLDENLFFNLTYNEHSESDEYNGIITNKDINFLLEGVDSDDYHDWISIGMALNNFDNSNKMFKIWDEWSKKSRKYDEDVTFLKWRSFNKKVEKPITIKTLFYKSKNREEFLNRKQKKNNGKMQEKINWKEELILSLINFDNKKFPWHKDIFKLDKGFYSLKTNQIIEAATFDSLYAGKVPDLGIKNQPRIASGIVKIYSDAIVNIKRLVFRPDLKPGPFIEDNYTFLNIYKGIEKPAPNIEYTKEFKKKFKLMINLFYLLVNNKKNVKILLKWIAYQIQNPGKPLKWAPYLQSVEGLGKSFIRHLLAAILGKNNVKVISSRDLTTSFNSYADPHALVGFIDEFNVNDKKARADVYSNFKELIGNNEVSVTKKGKDPYVINNYVSYFFCSNHSNNLKVSKTDRRFWIVFSDIESFDEAIKSKHMKGLKYIRFYKEIYSLTERKDLIDQLKKYFLEKKIKLSVNSRAPESIYKQSTVAEQENEIRYIEEARDLLKNPILCKDEKIWYNEKIVTTKVFFNDLMQSYEIPYLSPHDKSKILTYLNFKKVGKTIRLDNIPRTFYVKKLDPHINTKKIETLLNWN